MTKQYFWRTVISGALYVDSNTGDDINGTGTQQNPYQTLGRAYRGTDKKPTNIVCRGFFCEDMADGDHACTITAEYRGAAVFDGANVYTLYGFTTTNLVIENCVPGNEELTVYTSSALYAGVGRANGAGGVGATNAADLWGLAGSGGIVGQSGHYFGLIGGSGSSNVIYNPVCNDTYKQFIFGYSKPSKWAIHGVKKENRTGSRNKTDASNGFKRSIFTDVAFYISDHLEFTECYFGNDCTWWNNDGSEQIILEGNTSEEKIAFLEQKMQEIGTAANNCKFINCVFMDKSAEEIFNGPNIGDFTIKPEAEISSLIGPYPTALNIAIRSSEELYPGIDITNMWDPETMTNNITIENGEIILDTLEGEKDVLSSIYTGVIRIDTEKYNLSSLFTDLASKFDSKYVIIDKEVTGASITEGNILPIGKYIVKGEILYESTPFEDGDILTITQEQTTFTKGLNYDGEPEVVELLDPNLGVVVYMRTFPNLVEIASGTEVNLEEGKVYLVLESPSEATVGGRKIYKGSIIDGANGLIVRSEANVKLGVLNSTLTEWVPEQTIGNTFIIKNGGKISHDDDEIPLGSGNPNSYSSNTSGGAIKAGYNTPALNYPYVQFKLEVKKVW